ncbi:MAG: TlpA family protein disulfide reductase, partial [Verrucomicrobiota bacterium]|nr:TlpA family protein disulfide reductase [Verrucomicrobiota bacterium]
MKNIIKNAILFVVLSVVLSGFLACTKTASKESGQTVQTAPAGEKDAAAAKNTDYPPAPAAVSGAEIKTVDGSSFKVEDKKGKVVLLNLWATWCGPCRAEMPELIELQNKYKDKNFEIVGLNSDDETTEQIKDFAGKMNLNYTLGWADPKLMSELLKISKFNGIPQSYMIDRNGKLRGVFT